MQSILKMRYKKMISSLIIGIILITTCIPTISSADEKSRAIIYVDDDAISTWYDATHVRTIQEGINNATSLDTVYVYNGTYYEHIIVNKTVTLIGENATSTIIDGNNTGDIIDIQSNNVTISYFTIQHAGNPPLSHSGIIINSDNNQITNNIIKNNPIYGINIISSTSNMIKYNRISNNGEGVRLYYAISNTIQQNIIIGNNYGMRNWYSSQNIIHSNNLSNNNYYGIFHKECSQTSIQNNTISDASYGVRLWNGALCVFSENIIENNAVGISFDIDSNNHTVYNNYLDNTDNVIDNGVQNTFNTNLTASTNIIGGPYIGGNYWSDYTGYDNDADGIGDINIPHGPGDYYPLVRVNHIPVANFSYSPLSPSTLDTIQFTDLSNDTDGASDIVNWSWNFGDGNSSFDQHPIHSYSANGNFTVTLSIFDSQGVGNSTQQIITVSNLPPTAGFTYSPTNPITSDIIVFNSTSVDLDGYIVNWTWSFGDGSYGYTEHINHTYTNGTYNVVLRVVDNEGAIDITNQSITVNNIPPTADFTYFPANPTTEDIIEFISLSSDRSIVNWTWDFDDGSYSYTANTNYSYSNNGTYNVTLTVTDNDGALDTAFHIITVSNVGPSADFTYLPVNPNTSDLVQFNDTSVDTDGSVVNWTWDFGDGNSSFLQHPSHQYADDGVYNVTLSILDDDGASNNTDKLISIGNTDPVANFSYTPLTPSTADLISFNESSYDVDGYIVSWLWDFDDGNTSTLQNPSYQYADNGTYQVSLTVEDEDSGTDTLIIPITVFNIGPTASFTYSPLSPSTASNIQFTDTSTDTDGSIVNWTWDFGDGDNSYEQHPMHQYADNGTYNVSLIIIDDDGATDSFWMIINVSNAIPVPNFTWNPANPTVLDTVQFIDLSSDRSVVSWNWNFGDGNLSSLQNPTHQYGDDGQYNVTLYVSDDDGAINSVTKLLTVYTIAPIANFTYTPTSPSTSDIITFTDVSTDADGSIVNWTWDFGDGNSSFLQHPTHQYADNGTYFVTLTVTDDDNQFDSTQTQIIVANIGPSVNFTWLPSNPTTADTIQFTDVSSDPDGTIISWYWDFDDGYQSSTQHPSHNYIDDGIYNVSLTVTDDDGAVNTTIIPVSVANLPPEVSFTYSPLAPTTVDLISFTDVSTDADGSIVNWTWDFGDGNSSFLQHPTHSYDLAGNYTVNLTVTDDDNDSNSTLTIIQVLPRPACFDEVWVDDDYNSSLWFWQVTLFDSIQDAVDAVCPDGTIYVANGVYDEQIIINKSLTIIGEGQNQTIITNTTSLTNYFTTSANNYPIVYVYNNSDVIIQNLTIDGAGNGNSNYRYIGVGYYDAGGILNNVEIKSIRDTPFSGSQHGVAIYAYDISGTSRNLIIKNCDIYDYQKNAMSLNGADLYVEVRNNTITGAGPTNVTAQNGIQVGYSAQGLIDNNTVYGNWYTGTYWGASGGLVYNSDNIIITNNIFDTNQIAVYYYGSNGTVANNTFVNNEWSLVLWGDAYIYSNQYTNNTYDKTYMAEITSNNHCYTYVQDAIDNAPIGDTIIVYDGEYDENLNVNKDVTVDGYHPPTSSAQINGIIDITADGATVSDLLIMPGNVTGQEAAIMIAASNVTVDGTIIDGINGDGTGSIKGIHVYSTSNDQNILISNNHIINVTNPGNNTTYSGADGIMIQGMVDQITVIHNTIEQVWSYGWAYGIEVTPTGSHPTLPPTNVVVEENTIDTISATVWGQYASSFSVDAYANTYPANASQISLTNNNFINTPYGVINKDTINILDATCNYWDHYTGPYDNSSNADGLGCLIGGNVTFIPWLDNLYPLGDCIGGQCTDPIWVDDDAAVSWYDWDHVSTINLAMDRICPGGTIYIEPGLYPENFIIDKQVTIIGSGSDLSGTIISQNATGAGDSRIGIIQIIASGLSPTQPILIQDILLKPDHMAGISIGRFTESTGTDVFYLNLDNVNVIGTNTNPNSEQERGLYVDQNSSLQYLDVDNCAFNNLTYGWYLHKEVSADVSTVQYVEVENTTFNHNNLKGFYAEKLSDAVFKNCLIEENGFSSSGIPSYFLPWMSGFDINLKAGSYKNLIIENCSFINNALGGAQHGVGLTIKERGTGINPSSTYAAFPASVDDITITTSTFTGNERGMRFGEPGKGNIGPSNVTVEFTNMYDNINTYNGSDGSVYGALINVMQSEVIATCNWWGNETGPYNTSINPWGSGENVSGNVSFSPWLTDLYPAGICNGYLNAPPEVDFIYNPASPTTADIIYFTDISTDDGTIVNWTWTFGDGNISYNQHPQHQYADNGTYNVTLTVVDNFNVSNSTYKLINVTNALPYPDFTWSPLNPTTQDNVQFTDLSSDRSVESWFWDFGDSYSSSAQHPQHQYTEDGTYNVTLTVTDDDGDSNATTKTIIVSNVAPVADFSFLPTDPLIGDNITFTDNSIDVDGSVVNWSWTFGDGNISFDVNPVHSYSMAGNYTVCLTIIDNDNATDMICKYILVASSIDTIDINQSVHDRGFPIRHAADGDWAGGQDFLPTLGTISKVQIYLRKFGTPEFNLTVELREGGIEGTLIDSITFTPAEIPTTWTWFEIDFNDTAVLPSMQYFIVCPPAPSGVTTSFGYEWGYAFGDQYPDGAFWFTRDGGALWRDLPSMYEFTFKTYGY